MDCLLCSSGQLLIKEAIPKKAIEDLWLANAVDVHDEIKTPIVNAYHCDHCGLTFFDPQNAGGDKFYSRLGEYDWYYLHPGKTEYEYVQQYIKEQDHILDIGSGRGELFNRITKKVSYTGLELSSKAVELAKQSGIHVINENLSVHAKVNREQYNLVCLFQVLEHMTELDDFILDIKQCLKPGGFLCIAVPNNEGFISYTPNYTFNLPPHHTILWTERSLRYLAEKFELQVVDVHKEALQDVHRDIAYQSYLVYAIKKCFFLPSRLADNSKGHRLITRIASRLLENRFFRKLAIPFISKKNKDGQSIMVTLQKK